MAQHIDTIQEIRDRTIGFIQLAAFWYRVRTE